MNAAISWALIKFVRLYQVTLSRFMGGYCRFTPSCSAYFILAVQKHGPWRGALMGVWRILRCNPFCQGGEDLP